ncbi:MAG: hypothetical protein COA96_06965 [SAR86 cluster bacterium]|uniref:Uncharacterized protein n=1 Tax=SAR86 cluster bacterium TaxID=2030880 RepID=A0A2A5B3B2_9GAMM|nr:MAG: hypothetical protein COA96_06965 [SAR86 cluster bacterium]
MIIQIVKMEIMGNLEIFTGLLAMHLIGLFIFTFPLEFTELGIVIATTILPGSVAGLYVFSRTKKERRSRFLSQLPVTPQQIVIAEWIFISLIIALPCSVLFLAGLMHPAYTLWEVTRLFIIFYCALISFLAALSIAMDIPKLPVPYSPIIMFLWLFLITIYALLLPISMDTREFLFTSDRQPYWSLILTFYGIIGVTLLTAKYWLHGKVDDYLGN